MINEIKENPGEQNSSQVGSKTSSKKKNVNYTEAVPTLPMYCISDSDVTKVLKLLFVPEKFNPVKMIVEFDMGFCHLLDYDPCKTDTFSTLLGQPDTVEYYHLERLLLECELDPDFAARQLAKWNITKVSLGSHSDKLIDTKTYFEAYKQFLISKSEEMVIPCENEEIRFPYFSMFSLVDDAESDPS